MAEFEVNLSLKDGNNILTVRGKTVTEVGAVLKEAAASEDFKVFFGPGVAAGAGPTPAAETLASEATETPATDPAFTVSADEAQAAVTKHLGKTEELATPALLKVAAAASGKTVEELQGISKSEALRLKKEGK